MKVPAKYNETIYLDSQIDKIGNAIIYIAQNIKPLYKTKLLKLLYLLDEASVKTQGTPFLNLKYKVWAYGPVDDFIFKTISDLGTGTKLDPFLAKKDVSNTGKCIISAKEDFNDDEFSEFEIELMDNILAEFGHKSSDELVKITHSKDRPWFKIVTEKGLKRKFDSKELMKTEEPIPYKLMLEEDDYRQNIVEEYQELYG